jgi:hypothetical protein
LEIDHNLEIASRIIPSTKNVKALTGIGLELAQARVAQGHVH